MACGYPHGVVGETAGHGVLLVPVPELEGWVRDRTAHYDASFVSADPAFAHAHVTVLAPYPIERADLLPVLAGATPSFVYRLESLGVFPDGVIHLTPDPADAFRRLTSAARTALPEVEPYWGRHPVPSPHVTLDRVSESAGVSVESTWRALGDLVPATCRAEALLLTWWQSGACRVLASAPLGVR